MTAPGRAVAALSAAAMPAAEGSSGFSSHWMASVAATFARHQLSATTATPSVTG
jgi:hypothetical protein